MDEGLWSSKFLLLFTVHTFFWGGGGVEWIWKTGILSGPTFPTSRWLPHETPKKCPGQDAETLLHFASCFVNSPGWVKGSGILFFSWLISGKKNMKQLGGIQSSIYTRFITIFPNWSLYSPGGSLFEDIAKSKVSGPKSSATKVQKHMSQRRYHF